MKISDPLSVAMVLMAGAFLAFLGLLFLVPWLLQRKWRRG